MRPRGSALKAHSLCFNNSISFSLFGNLPLLRPPRHFHIWLDYFMSPDTYCNPLLNFDWDLLNSFIVFLLIFPISPLSLIYLLLRPLRIRQKLRIFAPQFRDWERRWMFADKFTSDRYFSEKCYWSVTKKDDFFLRNNG